MVPSVEADHHPPSQLPGAQEVVQLRKRPSVGRGALGIGGGHGRSTARSCPAGVAFVRVPARLSQAAASRTVLVAGVDHVPHRARPYSRAGRSPGADTPSTTNRTIPRWQSGLATSPPQLGGHQPDASSSVSHRTNTSCRRTATANLGIRVSGRHLSQVTGEAIPDGPLDQADASCLV